MRDRGCDGDDGLMRRSRRQTVGADVAIHGWQPGTLMAAITWTHRGEPIQAQPLLLPYGVSQLNVVAMLAPFSLAE